MSILSGFKSFERYIKTNSGYQKVSERTLAKDVLLGSDGSGNSVETEITNLNENLNQTEITIGDETLSTIDDKLNYLVNNLISKSDLANAEVVLHQAASTAGTDHKKTFTPEEDGTYIFIYIQLLCFLQQLNF